VSDPTVSETGDTTTASHSATAVATPPAPPAEPPSATAGTSGKPPRRKRTGAIVAVSLLVVAALLVGGIVWLVMWSSGRSHGGTVDTAATQAAFASAMKKAGVKADYPATPPVELSTIKATGSHTFSATFTPEEIGALVNTFSHTSDVAGMQIAISNATVTFPAAGTIRLRATVAANGSSYAGDVTAPVKFFAGTVQSPGPTNLTVEGISPNSAQTAQVGGALVTYANAVLAAAPKLSIDAASIQADGLHVSGSAPDAITYP
jgi:hypothetical protein